MHLHTNRLTILADQANSGDVSAETRFRQELEPQMVHMVRQALQTEQGPTPYRRDILTEARRVGLDARPRPNEERERLIHNVARRVCRSVLAALCMPASAGFHQENTLNNAAGASVGMVG